MDNVLNIDKKPSNLLHRMKNLVGHDRGVSEDLLKKLFLGCIPEEVRLILTESYELNLLDLASKADSILMFSSRKSKLKAGLNCDSLTLWDDVSNFNLNVQIVLF